MNTIMTRSLRPITLFCSTFILLAGSFFSSPAKAAYIGFHVLGSGNGYVVYTAHPRNYFRTSWRYIGRGCKKSCVINRWTGEVIRCKRRCY